jgi:anti-sigma regulatory factor (Ser/Thr protein kinase)
MEDIMAENQSTKSASESSDFSELINNVHKYIIGIGDGQINDDIIPNTTNMSMDDISHNMKIIRTHWFEGLQYFLMNGGKIESSEYLSDIYCFKHASSLTIEDEKKERLYGAHIYHKLPKESRGDIKDYATGLYDEENDRTEGNGLYLDLRRCIELEDEKQKSAGVINLEIKGEEIRQYIFFEDNKKKENEVKSDLSKVLNNPEKQELLIHAMREYPDRPVAYIITRGDNCSEKDYQATKDRLLIFSLLFFGRWCASWNQMRILAAEKLRSFNSHELGQIVFGINGTKSRLNRMDKQLQSGSRYPEYIIAKSNEFQDICKNVLSIEHDFGKHIEMLNVITESQDVRKASVRERITRFLPFNEIVFRWYGNFRETFIQSKKTLRIPNVELNDESRPAMYSDARKIEMIIYNFLTNADKYGYRGTVVDFNAELSEDNKYYLFTVIDLGYPLPKDETASENFNRIFAEGYRDNEVSKNIEGSGLGLYNAKVIADSFEAEIIPKSNCLFKYDIALFYAFSRLKGSFVEKEKETQKTLKLGKEFDLLYNTLLNNFNKLNEEFQYRNLGGSVRQTV